MDGWSKSAIVKEVVTSYEAMCRAKRSFLNIVGHLLITSTGSSSKIHRKLKRSGETLFQGSTTPTDLRFDREGAGHPEMTRVMGKAQVWLLKRKQLPCGH